VSATSFINVSIVRRQATIKTKPLQLANRGKGMGCDVLRVGLGKGKGKLGKAGENRRRADS